MDCLADQGQTKASFSAGALASMDIHGGDFSENLGGRWQAATGR